jgi:hypothetical protein
LITSSEKAVAAAPPVVQPEVIVDDYWPMATIGKLMIGPFKDGVDAPGFRGGSVYLGIK